MCQHGHSHTVEDWRLSSFSAVQGRCINLPPSFLVFFFAEHELVSPRAFGAARASNVRLRARSTCEGAAGITRRYPISTADFGPIPSPVYQTQGGTHESEEGSRLATREVEDIPGHHRG